MNNTKSVLATLIEIIGAIVLVAGILGALVSDQLAGAVRVALAFGALISGLLLIAAGTGVQSLLNIERNTATTAEATKFTADEYRKSLGLDKNHAALKEFRTGTAEYEAYVAAHPELFPKS
jgi:hypothetical protein